MRQLIPNELLLDSKRFGDPKASRAARTVWSLQRAATLRAVFASALGILISVDALAAVPQPSPSPKPQPSQPGGGGGSGGGSGGGAGLGGGFQQNFMSGILLGVLSGAKPPINQPKRSNQGPTPNCVASDNYNPIENSSGGSAPPDQTGATGTPGGPAGTAPPVSNSFSDFSNLFQPNCTTG